MAAIPAVSVIVPVHNRRREVVQAVSSACRQTRPPAEIIVIDDGSTDGSGEAIEGLHPLVRVLRQDRQGRSAARNFGIRHCKGDLVAFLDSDDVWLPHKLEVQVPSFVRVGSERVGMVAGHVLAIDSEGKELIPVTAICRRGLDAFVKGGCTAAACVRSPGVYTSSVIVRRSTLDDVGLFDPSLHANEDWDLWLRIARRWNVAVVPTPPIAEYRVHDGNTSSRAMAQGTIALARRQLRLEPLLPRSARAHLLVEQARAYRSLGDEEEARRALIFAARTHPASTLAGGAPRLFFGSVLASLTRVCRDGKASGTDARPSR